MFRLGKRVVSAALLGLRRGEGLTDGEDHVVDRADFCGLRPCVCNVFGFERVSFDETCFA